MNKIYRRCFSVISQHPLYAELVGNLSGITKLGEQPGVCTSVFGLFDRDVPIEFTTSFHVYKGVRASEEEVILREFQSDWEGQILPRAFGFSCRNINWKVTKCERYEIQITLSNGIKDNITY